MDLLDIQRAVFAYEKPFEEGSFKEEDLFKKDIDRKGYKIICFINFHTRAGVEQALMGDSGEGLKIFSESTGRKRVVLALSKNKLNKEDQLKKLIGQILVAENQQPTITFSTSLQGVNNGQEEGEIVRARLITLLSKRVKHLVADPHYRKWVN